VRTWTAKDCANNETVHTQTLTIVDTTAPVLSGVPADITVACEGPPAPPVVTATDNCDANPTVTLIEVDHRADDVCDSDGDIIRTWTATDCAGNQTTLSQTITADCPCGTVEVLKLTQGVVDPTKSWTFEVYEGPDGFGGTLVGSDNTFGDADGVLDFGGVPLEPTQTFTLCEAEVPAGFSVFWQIDTDGDGIADTTVIPYNPNENDDPPEDLGNRCVDFGAGTDYPVPPGGLVFFSVDNRFPGGEPRTPGYWKNWNRCSGGGQAENADRQDPNGIEQGYLYGFWLLEDVLDPNIGGGIVWDDILTDDVLFPITQCEVAVDILDQRELGDPNVTYDGPKHSNDAAYTLAMHLLAAQLNFGAGAETCDAALDAVLAGEALLDELDFDGTGTYLRGGGPATQEALALANTLDAYNNGELCVGPNVSIVSPAGGSTVAGTVTIEANVIDSFPINQVEFFVDGASVGTDTDDVDGWTTDWDSNGVPDGEVVINAVATNSNLDTGSGDTVVTVDNIVSLGDMHLGELTGTAVLLNGGKWEVTITAPVHVDLDHTGISGATVSGEWEDATPVSCITDGSASCDIVRPNINKRTLSVTFTVTDVSHPAWDYIGHGHGSAEITVVKP
jgi:hypothetical protein